MKSSWEICSIKHKKSLYGLKQSGHMLYNHLSQYLLKDRYKNDLICPCVFIKGLMIVVYINDLNIIGSPEEIPKLWHI